ncbi:hypothetical protein LC55x_4335 [Lysobacter capsici]|uniref:Uncharacterized protein n=1 Tax=Lysobacter capsici AZ78 TaxID=1444315 RepID=A0A108UCZ5_9GAMM|nr:hypothetical protein LC55x_4335 [Lysobacter capsici]KWS06630.1 hypothetical protein AZ78_4186 [Lysobacter capsici AZ78]
MCTYNRSALRDAVNRGGSRGTRIAHIAPVIASEVTLAPAMHPQW